jgi:hypothetical protein
MAGIKKMSPDRADRWRAAINEASRFAVAVVLGFSPVEAKIEGENPATAYRYNRRRDEKWVLTVACAAYIGERLFLEPEILCEFPNEVNYRMTDGTDSLTPLEFAQRHFGTENGQSRLDDAERIAEEILLQNADATKMAATELTITGYISSERSVTVKRFKLRHEVP